MNDLAAGQPHVREISFAAPAYARGPHHGRRGKHDDLMMHGIALRNHFPGDK